MQRDGTVQRAQGRGLDLPLQRAQGRTFRRGQQQVIVADDVIAGKVEFGEGIARTGRSILTGGAPLFSTLQGERFFAPLLC